MKAMCPAGVEIYATRVAFTADEEGLRGMRQHVSRAARDLAAEGLSDLIVFGCTVGSMIEGKGYDDQICAEITAETGIPAMATTTAVIAALQALGAPRVAVATPYTRRINAIEAKALRSYGVDVVNMKGYHEDVADSLFTNRMIGDLTEEDTYAFSRSVDCDEARCLFISCTNLRTMGIVGCLERDLGKPVLSSNVCMAWLALKRLNLSYRPGELPGCDCSLFRTLAP